MDDYIKVTYGQKPISEYPFALIRYLFKTSNPYIPKVFDHHEKVLDLGCGRGDFLLALWQNYLKAEGLDQCTPDIDLMTRYKIKVGDLEHPLPYHNDSFDIVFCKSVIEHLYYPEKLFKEVSRILRPAGYFVILTPDWDSTEEAFYRDFTHRTPFTMQSLQDIFKIYQFNNVKVNKFRQLPRVRKHEWLNTLCDIINFLPLYTPDSKNKWIKYSKEKMLLGVGQKHE